MRLLTFIFLIVCLLVKGWAQDQEILAPVQPQTIQIKDIVFQDNFEREELGNDFVMVDEDPDRWVMDEGIMIITSPPGKVQDPITNKQRNVHYNTLKFNKALPENFEITVEWEIAFTRSPNQHWDHSQYLSIKLQDKIAQLEISFGQKGDRWVHYFSKWLRNEENSYLIEKVGAKQQNPLEKIRLRLVKQKYTFKAYVQRTGTTWKELGTHTILKLENPQLLISQSNGFRGQANKITEIPEIEVYIKEVTIREVE